MMEIVAIIPSRYGSTRFPGKPLIDIKGKTMINRVYEQTKIAVDKVFVATDDRRIFDHVVSFGGAAIMTSTSHKSGTDRCAEAAEKISNQTNSSIDVVINIQGDEPFIKPAQIKELCDEFNEESIQLATLAKQFKKNEEIFDPNKPKVILNKYNEAIYFSRSPIPYMQNVPDDKWIEHHDFFKHVGLYGYRYNTLQEITRLPGGILEKAESLEQNRWIENGYKIKVALTNEENIAVDTPKDLEKIV